MRAGPMRYRVTFQENVPTTRDEFGQPVENWTNVTTVWASVEPLAGRELWYAREILETATHKITCRWSSATTATLSSACRATLTDGRVFEGEWVRNLEERRVQMEFVCIESPLPALWEVIDDSGSRAFIDDTGYSFSCFGYSR